MRRVDEGVSVFSTYLGAFLKVPSVPQAVMIIYATLAKGAATF